MIWRSPYRKIMQWVKFCTEVWSLLKNGVFVSFWFSPFGFSSSSFTVNILVRIMLVRCNSIRLDTLLSSFIRLGRFGNFVEFQFDVSGTFSQSNTRTASILNKQNTMTPFFNSPDFYRSVHTKFDPLNEFTVQRSSCHLKG